MFNSTFTPLPPPSIRYRTLHSKTDCSPSKENAFQGNDSIFPLRGESCWFTLSEKIRLEHRRQRRHVNIHCNDFLGAIDRVLSPSQHWWVFSVEVRLPLVIH